MILQCLVSCNEHRVPFLPEHRLPEPNILSSTNRLRFGGDGSDATIIPLSILELELVCAPIEKIDCRPLPSREKLAEIGRGAEFRERIGVMSFVRKLWGIRLGVVDQ